MPRHKLTRAERSRGGVATARKIVPSWTCPDCQKQFQNVLQVVISGHRGFEVFAQRYAGGDHQVAKQKLALCGQAATDPVPENGAFRRAHDTLAEIRTLREQYSTDRGEDCL